MTPLAAPPRARRLSVAVGQGLLATLLAAALAAPGLARAQDEPAWGGFTEENNNLGEDHDRYYVNGFSADYLSRPLDAAPGHWAARTARGIEDALPGLFPAAGDRDRR